MASIFKRNSKTGKGYTWRAVIRKNGYRPICETFDRRQKAEDWGHEIEHQIKIGQYKFGQQGAKQTFDHLIDRYEGGRYPIHSTPSNRFGHNHRGKSFNNLLVFDGSSW